MKVSSSSEVIDKLLQGGFEKDVITTVYGPAGSGKTLLCLLALVNIAKSGKKVVYIDTEGGFSVERLRQIDDNYKKILDNIVFLRPTSFKEQKSEFEKLKRVINDKVGLVIVDTIAMLYRLELGKAEEVYEINRELGRQLSYLAAIARKKNIPIIITNQVYADFDDKDKVNLVGGDLLKYSSKCLIELQITPDGSRRAILRKHRSIAEENEALFKIVEKGLIPAKESKGFKLF